MFRSFPIHIYRIKLLLIWILTFGKITIVLDRNISRDMSLFITEKKEKSAITAINWRAEKVVQHFFYHVSYIYIVAIL